MLRTMARTQGMSDDGEPRPRFRYYPLVLGAFVTVLLCSNLIGPGKTCILHLPFSLPWIGAFLTFGAGNLFFPISYIFDDVLTEVYGYAQARKVIWVPRASPDSEASGWSTTPSTGPPSHPW